MFQVKIFGSLDDLSKRTLGQNKTTIDLILVKVNTAWGNNWGGKNTASLLRSQNKIKNSEYNGSWCLKGRVVFFI